MSLSMYTVLVPPVQRSLSNLRSILEKGQNHCESKSIAPTVLISARLYPDMYPLSRQVQIATDVAKGAVYRLAGQEPPKFEDNETSFSELITRIDNTLALYADSDAESINRSEESIIEFSIGNQKMTFKGLPYLQDFVLPNVYFHVSTTYAILRHNGVELGKRDFLGNIF